jgi:flagellar protein FliO/FliZ
VAIAAYLFTRRKRGTTHRQIEILESASLGPKRSLIVARVGEETLYLGASEAGITLLKSSAPAHAVPAVVSEGGRVAVVNELDQSLTDALADVPEPSAPIAVAGSAAAPASFRSIEGGLASLFGRGVAVPARPEPRSDARSESRGPARFEEILEDSLEDQELRRKLAAGMSARVR